MTSNASPRYHVEGSGPFLIYVARLDGAGELFFKQAPRLARAYRVVTFRSRDHGRFTYEDLTGDLAAIIRDLGEQQATILGESFGGTVALSFALVSTDGRTARSSQLVSALSKTVNDQAWREARFWCAVSVALAGAPRGLHAGFAR